MLTKHVDCEIPENIIKSAEITASVYGRAEIIMTVEQENVGSGGQFAVYHNPCGKIGRTYKIVATITDI